VAGCLLRLSVGCIKVLGQAVGAYSETDLAEIRRKHFGFIFQGIHLLPALTAAENVRLALEFKGESDATVERRALELLALTGVADLAERLPKDMSGGQRQRVAISRALAGRPKVVLADEPTAALDGVNAKSVLSLLRKLTRQMALAVLVVTHDRGLFKYADRLLTLHDGRIVRTAAIVRKSVK
jgi:putative ABC transport system ATP-binding protein